jgi:hypothetical protein
VRDASLTLSARHINVRERLQLASLYDLTPIGRDRFRGLQPALRWPTNHDHRTRHGSVRSGVFGWQKGVLASIHKGCNRGAGDLVTRLCVLLFLHPALYAQDRCGVEVKLLLSPTETQATISALNLEKETAGRVYFFDTSALDLLSQGAIVRLRQGDESDLTVKLRPLDGRQLSPPSNLGEGFKCEVDLIRGRSSPSYSVLSKFTGARLPQTGADILSLLGAGQKELLKQAQVSVDWTRVKRIADIQSTDWQTKTQPHFSKLTLELWEWSGGRILELSTKVEPDAGAATYRELQQLVKTKGLSLNPSQQAKTPMVLETLTHGIAH